MTPIADTGLLVGYLDRADQYFEWARTQFNATHTAFATCEAVITEAEYLAQGSGPLLMEMISRGTLTIQPILPNEARSLAQLMRKYPKMQFADACIVHLSEALPNAVVYTTDRRDFSIYRRRGNDSIKFIAP